MEILFPESFCHIVFKFKSQDCKYLSVILIILIFDSKRHHVVSLYLVNGTMDSV